MKRLKNPRNVLFPFFFILQFFHQSTEGFLIVLDSMVGSRSLSFCFSFSEKKHSVDWGKSFSQSAGKKMGLLGTNKTISVTQLQSHLRLRCSAQPKVFLHLLYLTVSTFQNGQRRSFFITIKGEHRC